MKQLHSCINFSYILMDHNFHVMFQNRISEYWEAESSQILILVANVFGIFKLSRYVFEHQFIQPFTSKSSENYRCHLVLNYWFTIGLADPDSGIAFEFDFVVFVASALHVIPPSLASPQLWNMVKHS